MQQISFLIVISIFYTFGCQSKQSVIPKSEVNAGIPSFIHFKDSLEASKAIVTDDMDGFFEKISISDMHLQMKITNSGKQRIQLLKEYKTFLSTEVLDWTFDEKQKLYLIFDSIRTLCNVINPKLYPEKLSLVKIRTNHYGPDVYYTRANMILVPENVLKTDDFTSLIPVMVHELFHVVSRFQPKLRDSLYALIGFHPNPFQPSLCEELKDRILTNPDGTNLGYTITLGDSIEASPVIFSTSKTYNPLKPRFFEYLHFDLFKYTTSGGSAFLECGKDASTTLQPQVMPDFFRQIKDNTQYIIHPDEIMAENFKMALLIRTEEDRKTFSPEGNLLLDQVMAVIRKW
ncbi:MAG: hypothetical protein R2774_15105 [Saprospiraceae bacterium]